MLQYIQPITSWQSLFYITTVKDGGFLSLNKNSPTILLLGYD